MSVYGILFYLLAIVLVASTLVAITRREAVHAVVYLILSFIAIALIFYLLGAPFLALLEIIIYAGAIMVFFLFIVMMLRPSSSRRDRKAVLTQWIPAIVLGVITVVVAGWMLSVEPVGRAPLKILRASPADLGRFLFQEDWFLVEVASFLLLVALVGAFYLGREKTPPREGS